MFDVLARQNTYNKYFITIHFGKKGINSYDIEVNIKIIYLVIFSSFQSIEKHCVYVIRITKE